MRTRYNLAKSHSTKDSDVLEIACGSGIGLGYISENAKKMYNNKSTKRLNIL